MVASNSNICNGKSMAVMRLSVGRKHHFHDRQHGMVLVCRPFDRLRTSATDSFFHVVFHVCNIRKLTTQLMTSTCWNMPAALAALSHDNHFTAMAAPCCLPR